MFCCSHGSEEEGNSRAREYDCQTDAEHTHVTSPPRPTSNHALSPSLPYLGMDLECQAQDLRSAS